MSLATSRIQRSLVVYVLCFAEGLPLGFVNTALSAWLVKRQYAPAQVGTLLAMFTIGFALKPVWGPVVDRFSGAGPRKRRHWLLFGQGAMSLVAVACAIGADLGSSLAVLSVGTFLLAACLALQDVATDALMVDVVPDDERPKINAIFIFAQVSGYAVAATGLSSLLEHWGHRVAFLSMAVFLALLMLPIAFMRESDGPVAANSASNGAQAKLAVAVPLAVQIRVFGVPSCLVALLALTVYAAASSLARGSFEFLSVRELGWSSADYSRTFGLALAIGALGGAALGAWANSRWDAVRLLRIYALVYGGIVLVFGALTYYWSVKLFMIGVWVATNVVAAAATVAVYSTLQRLAWSTMVASQLGIFTGGLHLGTSFGLWAAGRMAGAVSYQLVYLFVGVVVATLALPLRLIDVGAAQRAYMSFSVPERG